MQLVNLNDTLNMDTNFIWEMEPTLSSLFKWADDIGAGANGKVEAVHFTPDRRHKEPYPLYARKTFLAPKGGPGASRDAMQHEFEIMRKISRFSEDKQKHMAKLFLAYRVSSQTDNLGQRIDETFDYDSRSWDQIRRTDNEHAQHYIVMLPIADKNLNAYLRTLTTPLGLASVDTLLRMMGCLVTGLAILHEEHIRHHDIHPGNILIHGTNPLYADFGLSYCFDSKIDSKTLENPYHNWIFAAPEYKKKTERGTASDVFALGGVLYEILAVLTQDQNMLQYRGTGGQTIWGLANESKEARKALSLARKSQNSAQVGNWLRLVDSMLTHEHKNNARPRALAISKEVHNLMLPMCDCCRTWVKTQR